MSVSTLCKKNSWKRRLKQWHTVSLLPGSDFSLSLSHCQQISIILIICNDEIITAPMCYRWQTCLKEICTLYRLFWSDNRNFRNIPECAVIETKWDGWDGKPLFCHDVDQFYSPNTHIFQRTLMFVTPYWSGRLAVSCFGNTDVWSRQDRMWSLVEQNLKPHWLKLWVFEWKVYGLNDHRHLIYFKCCYV